MQRSANPQNGAGEKAGGGTSLLGSGARHMKIAGKPRKKAGIKMPAKGGEP